MDSYYRTYDYPISSARDESQPSIIEDQNPSQVHRAARANPSLPRASEAYPVELLPEVVPGILADGRLTIRHPMVSAYLDRLQVEFSKALDEAGSSKMSVHGSVLLGRVEDVGTVLGLELSMLQSKCILALAALRVYYNVHHPVHFALWGKNVKTRTEETVRQICYHTPRVISSPVCWMGAKENLWLLNTQQLLAFPELSRNQPRERPQRRMTLRQRKGRAAGAALPSAGPGRATPRPTSPPPAAPIPAGKEKGKQVERRGKPTQPQERPATRWFRSRRNAQEDPEGSVVVDGAARGEAQQKPLPLLEVAPGVLVVEVEGSGNGEKRTEVEHPAEVEATHEEPPRTSVGMPAPTRRSSRQAIKRRAVEAAMAAVASGSGSMTPVGLPGRGSSTAVSEVSERTTVGQELQGVRAKKRKASELDAEEAQATEGKRKAKPRTTAGGRKRRR